NPIEIDLKKLNLWAMEFRPEVKSAMYKLEMDNIAVKLSLTRSYPDILLGASYDRQGVDSLKQENMQVSLAVKLPIGYDYTTQIKQKRAEQRQTVLRQAAIEDALRMQVLEAYNNLNFWQTETPVRIKTWEKIETQFKDFIKTDSALKDTFESLNYYYQAGIKSLEAQKEHLMAIASLENAVGKDLK
ncbi:MAG: TolC family protein, partial [Elusimicrobiaceae bacterium]|nr:TolC family protein [Elusimicrobiaceae bacterium]